MGVILFSTDQVPQGMEVKRLFSAVQMTGVIQISQKSLLKGLLERGRNETEEMMQQLRNLAPSEANAIIGIQVSTAAQHFNNGTFLYVTYLGTPAILGDVEDE